MKRNRTKHGKAKTHASASTPKPPRKRMSRRDLISNLGMLAGGIAVLGAGGWYVIGDVQAGIREADLSRIGNGRPAVVQIHDPQCTSCLALQKEARAALDSIDHDRLQYVVANIRQPDGRRLADAHGVGHVTLLLFDGAGRRREVLQGNYSAAALEEAFRAHLDSVGES